MEFLKSITGKVVAGLVALGVIAAAISWWQMDEQTRTALLSGTGRVFVWLMIVLLAPWATIFVTWWVARLERNWAGALLVGGYTLAEALLLAWLFDFAIAGVMGWAFFFLGVLVAGVYNLFTCDWIAEKTG